MAEPGDGRARELKELTGRIGKYQILRTLGRGAMGHVYVAHDTVLDRDVALKVMRAQIADDPELKQRFEREARAIARMTHPNVVTVFDLGSHSDGSPFIAMELLRGQDLHRAMRQVPPLALERKVVIIIQVLAGLAHAHAAGIVHRDIKPANIFINDDGTVKIMDFGVARLTTASMTGTGNIVGTADYMSPEQVQGAKVDGRSDLFSVGCLLYELLAGRRPFHAESLMAIFYKITHDDVDLGLIPAGPEHAALQPILRKALARSAAERYQTAGELARDLRDWLRMHAPGVSSQSGLEDGGAAATLVDGPDSMMPTAATAGLASPRTGPLSRRTAAGTRAAGPTVREPAPARGVARRAPARRAARSGAGVLPWLGGVLLLALVLGGLVWRARQPAATSANLPPVATTLTPATAPPMTEPPETTLPAPPVTAAPAPSFAPAEGRAKGSDREAVELRQRVDGAREAARRDAEAQAQQARRARVSTLLAQAASAMEAKQFDAAVAGYNRVLELEPGNVAALTGKSNAITARTVAEAAAGAGRPAVPLHGFSEGRTEAKGREAGAGMVGFQEGGVAVQRATQAAELPGKIHFDTIPVAPQPGERFSVSAYLRNEGSQPIRLASMLIATTVDGKTQKGPVPLVTTTVAPRDRALVFQARDQLLREGTKAWSLEVSLFTAAGESYRSTLSWK